jgi:excisionase family DNA binding protein
VTALGKALLDSLAPSDLAELAQTLQPYLAPAITPAEDRWLTSKQAADYLAISVHALHRLTSERRIPFEQSGPGGRCYFRKSELDRWRSAWSRSK